MTEQEAADQLMAAGAAGVMDVTVTPEPCQCHKSFAPVTGTHPGHCCFVSATQTCHPAEVAEWERQNALRQAELVAQWRRAPFGTVGTASAHVCAEEED